jgi:hypothetical protein
MEAFAGSNQIELADDKINKYTVVLAIPKGEREAQTQHSYSGFKMNAVGVFIVLSIALLLSATTVQGAALASVNVSDNPTSLPPATITETTTVTVKTCHNSTPCGWAVYVPYTRRVDYFMKNTCNCPSDKSCQRYEDDLSVSAYVYRCGEKQQTTENLDVPSD